MFRTEIPLNPHPQPLSLTARVLTVGSCFSDVLGNRLNAYKVKALTNPFGTVFNPLSACKLLRAAAGEDTDWQQHLVAARGRWQSYDLHASVGADSPVLLLQHIQEVVQRTGEFLQTTDVVLLTLGTAYAYRLRDTQELVSNCHKIPAEQFEKELLTPDEIINAIAETHALLRQRNPKLRFVLTVSPVRHLKDTLPLNAVSKSVLRVACHYLSELLPDVTYFPAYELLMDDLRDYRFYAADMLHPSSVAEDYVWERFAREHFDSDFGRFRKEWDAVRQALAHRPLHPAAPEHRQFLEATLARLERLSRQVDVRPEMREVQKRLHDLPMPIQPRPAPMSESEEDEEERIDIGQDENAPQSVATSTIASSPLPSPVPVEAFAEDVATDPTPDAVDETPVAPFKKKRRSRGGAKRSGRKKAAQLAASLAEAATEALTTAVPAPNELAAAEPAPALDAPLQVDNYTDTTVDLPEEIPTGTILPPNEVSEATEEALSVPEAAPARPKRRTAAQVKAAKTARKPAKATSTKSGDKPKSARPSRRKPADTAMPPTAPPSDGPVAVETTSPADTNVAKKATPRRGQPARKKPASPADQSTPES